MAKNVKPMSEWTEADFTAESEARKVALAGVASQMEAEIAQANEAHENE